MNRSRRGWTFLDEVERRQESLRAELSEYVGRVQDGLPDRREASDGRLSGELTVADFTRWEERTGGSPSPLKRSAWERDRRHRWGMGTWVTQGDR